MTDRTYIAIDLKSFYASVECVDRGLDPLDANLVVADESRTEKTICLAVSPSLKKLGIPGRARLFEVLEKVKEVNASRRTMAPGRAFTGSSVYASELERDRGLEVSFVTATPRMAHYMEVSTGIYDIYLKYVAPEDMHVYSIDEVFIDATPYLRTYNLSARDFAMKLIHEVLDTTGITATAGIGTNMYLAKIAMDVEAKHIPADKDGVRIAELDEMSYRRKLWSHRPLTDFWRVGKGYSRKLEAVGIMTMGDIARMSLIDEEVLYRMFGVNAELLIDHAWGWEPCTMKDIHTYVPENNSISSGQVLASPYDFEKARLIFREMTDLLTLQLVDKQLETDQMVLTVGYDIENLSDPDRKMNYKGPVTTDRYGRKIPKSAHGSVNLGSFTTSSAKILDAVTELYNEIVDPELLVRRMYVVANHAVKAGTGRKKTEYRQLDLFTDPDAEEDKSEEDVRQLDREKNVQKALLEIKKKYGKNAVLRGMNLEEGATAISRNSTVGGHRA